MSSIFDFTRPGPGIEKDAPQKKGVSLYFELLWRKSGKLILANIMYFFIGLPVFLLYYLLIFRFISNISIDGYQASSYAHLALILALIVSTFWGLGPITSGYTYILRNSARDEHFWLVNDFFKKTKENFKYCIIIFIIDIIQLFIAPQALLTYWSLARNGNLFCTFITAFLLLFILIYTIMHFYIFELMVTFKMNFTELCKNSFILSLANIPACILFITLIIVSSFLIMGNFTAILIAFISAFFWYSIFRFAIDFYVARKIQNDFIKK